MVRYSVNPAKGWYCTRATIGAVLEETEIALKNYDWMIRSRGLEDVLLHWDSGTIVYGDGGAVLDTLLEPGFTPATRNGG